MAVGLTILRDADVPALFRIGIMRSVPFLLARFQEAESHVREIDRKQAQRVLSYVIKLDEAWPQVRDLIIAMAPKMEQAGHREDWIVYLESGIEKSQKLGDMEAEGELRFHIGVLYEQMAMYDDARGQLEASAAYFEKVGHSSHQGRALNRLAYVARRQRRFEEAKRLAEYSLGLSEGVKTEQAYSYFVLGAIAYDHQSLQESYVFFSKSLALREEIKDERMIAWSLTNLGAVLERNKRFKEAIPCYQRAMKLFNTIQDPVHEAVARMNLGNIYFRLKRFEQALNLYLLAESTFDKTKAWLRLAEVNNNKAMAYQKLQQWDKAKQACEFSIKQWQRIGNMNQVVNTMDSLGSVYLEQNLCDEAIATYQDALNQLAQIEDDPAYDYLFGMVSRHLQDAREQHILKDTP